MSTVERAVAERHAEVVWEGDLMRGNGTLSLGSGAAGQLPVTWSSRTERSEGQTSPEELIAAAHASCYAMAFSNTLAEKGNPPTRLDVTAVCTFDKTDTGFKVGSVTLTVRGQVPGMDQTSFEEAAQEGEQGCPVSNALRGNVDIRVEARLENG